MLLNSSSLPMKCPGTRLQGVMVSNSEFLGDLTSISGFGNTTQVNWGITPKKSQLETNMFGPKKKQCDLGLNSHFFVLFYQELLPKSRSWKLIQGTQVWAKKKQCDLGLNSHFFGLFYQISQVSGNLSYSVYMHNQSLWHTASSFLSQHESIAGSHLARFTIVAAYVAKPRTSEEMDGILWWQNLKLIHSAEGLPAVASTRQMEML